MTAADTHNPCRQELVSAAHIGILERAFAHDPEIEMPSGHAWSPRLRARLVPSGVPAARRQACVSAVSRCALSPATAAPASAACVLAMATITPWRVKSSAESLAAARRYRTVLKNPALSATARAYLQTNLDELERRAADPARLDEEGQRASKQTRQAEAREEAGVYVYALPHYIRHPYDQASGRTLLKVGHSQSDVIVRFRNHIRTTALPEEPILLRIYRTNGDSAPRAEAAFHRLLDAADHSSTIGRSAGREWFLTHTRFLDEIAATLGLQINVINEAEFDDS
jgi:hypothetical protein